MFFGESPEFYTDYSDDETGTEAQFAYISDYIQKIEDAVMSENFKDKNGIPVSEYLDFRSTASYWWVNHFLKKHDSFATTSTYLYKERSGKLFFGPLWDFDQSMTGENTEGFYKYNTLWLNRLRANNAEYRQTLFDTWDKLDSITTDIVKATPHGPCASVCATSTGVEAQIFVRLPKFDAGLQAKFTSLCATSRRIWII